MTTHDEHDDTAHDPKEGAELPQGLHLWAVLDGYWEIIAEGRAATTTTPGRP